MSDLTLHLQTSEERYNSARKWEHHEKVLGSGSNEKAGHQNTESECQKQVSEALRALSDLKQSSGEAKVVLFTRTKSG